MKRSYSNHNNGMEKGSSGFTLIELLVVIAIISLLAAILFPVFASAREKARQSACLSNEKQIGLAFIQYEQDYDEVTMPNAVTSGNYYLMMWMDRLYPYIKAVGVYTCPSRTGDPGENGVSYSTYIPVPQSASRSLPWMGTYAVNYMYYNTASRDPKQCETAGCGVVGHLSSDFIAPANLVAFVESGQIPTGIANPAYCDQNASVNFAVDTAAAVGAAGTATPQCGTVSFPTVSQGNYTDIEAPHMGFTNVIWADGHAKSMQPENLIARHASANGGTQIMYNFDVSNY